MRILLQTISQIITLGTEQRFACSSHHLILNNLGNKTRTIRATPMSTHHQENHILHSIKGSVGFITLNRPKALNALTTTMIQDLHTILKEWHISSLVSSIIIKGAGDKAFCAGGDVKAVIQLGQQGHFQDALAFFTKEYRTNYLISTLQKPYIAILDGITMGGGAGVSIHGMFRIATENTLFAMPECAIGLYPDVGASFFLSRLPMEGLGLYLGLTGARIKGINTKHAGLATHFIKSSLIPELEEEVIKTLASCNVTENPIQQLQKLLNSYDSQSSIMEHTVSDTLTQQGEKIKKIFGDHMTNVEEIYNACTCDGSDFSRNALVMMKKGSPTSQKITFEQIRKGRHMPLDECLKMENRLVYRMVMNTRSDFYCGVDAMLISKSGKPEWKPAELSDVSDSMVQSLFEKNTPNEELQLPVEVSRSAVRADQKPRL